MISFSDIGNPTLDKQTPIWIWTFSWMEIQLDTISLFQVNCNNFDNYAKQKEQATQKFLLT